MELHLKVIGILLIALALAHTVFPGYFKWKDELNLVSHINRQMMYVHAFFIAFAVFLAGVLCLTSAKELVSTPLGNKMCLGFGIFWAARLFIQFFGYSSAHWRGKKLETTIHIIFAILWVYLSVVFLGIYFF